MNETTITAQADDQELPGFDAEFYRGAYNFADKEHLSAQQHYLTVGWKEWRNPNRDFDTLYYYMSVSGLTQPDLCPLAHFISTGFEGPRNRTEAMASGPVPIDLLNLLVELPTITNLFDAKYYCDRYPDVVMTSSSPLEHYLTNGWKEGRNPSAAFETLFYRERFMNNDSADICPLIHYARFGHLAKLPTTYSEARRRAVSLHAGSVDPTEALLASLDAATAAVLAMPYFDQSFYLSTYGDVAVAGIDAGWHYRTYGWAEQRYPRPNFDTKWYTSRFMEDRNISPLLHFSTIGRIAELPTAQGWSMPVAEQTADAIWSDWLDDFLRRIGVDTKIYEGDRVRRIVFPMFSIAHYRARMGLGAEVSDVAAFLRYLTVDLPAGVPPGPLFSEQHYLSEVKRLNLPLPIRGERLFLHWLTHGLARGASPTPAFTAEEYLILNPDLKTYPESLFDHFLRHGLDERRRFSALTVIATSPTAHLKALADSVGKTYCETVARSAEEGDEFAVMNDFLKSGKLADTVAEAAAIEPDIGTLPATVHAMIPPWHDGLWLGYVDILSLLPKDRFDAIVLMPFCKLGGADFVAGVLASELAKTRRTLILRTDADDWARPDWFAPEVETVDISAYLAVFSPEVRKRILYTLLLKLGASDVYNVNSRLAFDTFKTYGERLTLSTRLHAYYFCADRTREGVETGYPVWYFSTILPHLTTAMIDNTPLANQLIDRFRLTGTLRDRVKVFYTPAITEHDGPTIAENQIETSSKRRRKRVLWAGRFDRQKRFDLLVDIARLLPEVDFVAWGKPVLDAAPDMANLPQNLTVHGPFDSYDELPLADSDGWLYTSAWDGIPTILIELGAMGMPIVASTAGGVAELIDATTGWPVSPDEDALAYADAVEDMLASEDDRLTRAASVRQRILARHSRTTYARLLETANAESGDSANV